VTPLIKVKKRHNESSEQLIRRFRKEVTKAKVMSEVRRRRWFVSKSELRRIKAKKAARRLKRRDHRVRRPY
jgi:small subunit ribosomal protein S21